MEVKPIGIIYSPFRNAEGVPIQPVFAKDAEGTVELAPEYAEALADLDGFERIWLLYWFDRAAPFKAKVKPYLDDQTHGLFATRAPALAEWGRSSRSREGESPTRRVGLASRSARSEFSSRHGARDVPRPA